MTQPLPSTSERAVCDCAEIPPTMPTCRTEHLYDCPITVAVRWHEFETARTNGRLTRDFAPIKDAMQRGDTKAVAAWLNRDAEDRAKAAYLRSRHRR